MLSWASAEALNWPTNDNNFLSFLFKKEKKWPLLNKKENNEDVDGRRLQA